MKCLYCGFENPDNQSGCNACGKIIRPLTWCPKGYEQKEGKTLCADYVKPYRYWVTEKHCEKYCTSYRARTLFSVKLDERKTS